MSLAENKTALSILVIDNDAQIQRLLTIALKSNGYRVATAGNGELGIAAAAQNPYDAIILDLSLPDMNGIAVLKDLREWTQTPIVILSVQDGEHEKVECLDSGADDYVTKPFNTAELLARLRAIIRRANHGQAEEPIRRFGPVEINLAVRRVTKNGQPVKLTATEYTLLRLFVQHAGKVLTHRQILREVWGMEYENQTQYLRVYMVRLRERLETNPDEPALFATEPGVGYRLIGLAAAST